jgi:hypothetical protein
VTSDRFGALSALFFSILLLVGAALLDLPGHDDDDQRLTAFYGDAGNRLRVVLGAYALALAGISFLGFGAALTVRAERRGAPMILTRLMLLSCAVAAVLLTGVGAAQGPTYALSISAFDEPESQLTRATIPHIGYSLLLVSTLAASAFIGVTAAAVRVTAMLREWVVWSGFVAAGLLLFSIFFMPMIALPVWVLAVGTSLWRSNSLAASAPR